MDNIGRNDPCPCGSGKKYKKCCFESGFKEAAYQRALERDKDIVPIDSVGDYGVPLPDGAFFEKNSLHEVSGLRMLYSMILNPNLEGLANKLVRKILTRGQDELKRIKNAQDVKTLVDIMRGNPDMMNHVPLMERILQHKGQAVPLILRELQATQNDSFVELSARILHRAGVNCSDEIINIIRNGHNRSAYAIAIFCVLLGFCDNADSEKLLWDYYYHLRKYFPHETYSDGSLLGMIEIRERRKERALLN